MAGSCLLVAGCGADPLRELARALPPAVAGWQTQGADEVYDPTSIFSYLDGHAEVYLAYDMAGCLARRYTGPPGEADLVLDVFLLGSPADAYGVFTHDQDGETVALGEDGLLRPGWLSFWKGPCFVSVYAENDTESSRRAMLELGGAVARAITAEGERPPVVTSLPSSGLVDRSVHYLHHPTLLAYHLASAGEDLLALDRRTPAALASYRRGEASARLLVVDYPSAVDAEAARTRLGQRVAGCADSVPATPGGSAWSGCRLVGTRLAVVLAQRAGKAPALPPVDVATQLARFFR